MVATGQKLPPQRELADLIGVNLSTITRALNECRRRGLTSGTVGSGTFISTDINSPYPCSTPVHLAPLYWKWGLCIHLLNLQSRGRLKLAWTCFLERIRFFQNLSFPSTRPWLLKVNRKGGRYVSSKHSVNKKTGFPIILTTSQRSRRGWQNTGNPVFKPFFRRLFVFYICHQHNTLHVISMWKHIHRLDFFCFVAVVF